MTSIPANSMELMIQHSVMINEGSGVLFQPASGEYSYVLTAKHVIAKLKDEQIQIIDTTDQQLRLIDRYWHERLDAAILKVEFQAGLKVPAYSDRERIPTELMLRGFPRKSRRQEASCRDQLEAYTLEFINKDGSHWTFRNKSSAPYEDVEGCSGGGVFCLGSSASGPELFLAGIEYNMPGEGAGKQHDHIGCIPIHVFHEIIEIHKLAELKPLYLTGFQHLVGGIFPQKYYEDSVPDFEYTQVLPLLNGMRTHCNRSLENLTFTPKQLLEDHPDKLSVGVRPAYELEDEDCWFKFLEFLTLLSLVNDRGFDQLCPDAIFKEFKVVYIRSEKSWLVHFRDVLCLDTTGLDPGGKIILFLNDTPGSYAVISKEDIDSCVQNIYETRDDPAVIDAAQAIQKDGHTLIQWVTLHDELIFRRRAELAELVSAADQKTKIQELYHQYLRFREVMDE